MFFLSLIPWIRDLGIQIFIPLSTSMAFSVLWRIQIWAQVYFSFRETRAKQALPLHRTGLMNQTPTEEINQVCDVGSNWLYWRRGRDSNPG